MNIGFMGGSFNPPHLGHLNAAKVFYTESKLDKLIIIPAKVSPFKVEEGYDTKDFQRFDMSVLCFNELNKHYGFNVEVSSMELDRQGISYTYLTVNELKKIYPHAKLTMYVGSDMFFTLEKWKNSKEIFENCTIYTRSRKESEMSDLLTSKALYESKYNAKILISDDKEVVVSSTLIRDSLNAKKSSNCKNLLTEDVLRYIIKNKLYFQEQYD